MFGHKSPSAFSQSHELLSLLALSNSRIFLSLVLLQMAFGSYEVGVVRRTPVPDLDNPRGARLGELALACVELKRDLDRVNDAEMAVRVPASMTGSASP